ncbi:Glu-tRNA(Gln) amidotransferase subunit GatD [Candidatus Woesearchaeota archaeon]|nr:Glu-tRNA(Gln) amidotransferase subunit GatD [Candidatus Woesearchaeota archaeon]
MEQGQHVSFSYEGKELVGTVVTVKDDEATIKLDSGYNLIVSVSKVSDVQDVLVESEDVPVTEIKQKTTLPRVVILHTGGTIASKVDYSTGAVVAQFDPDELVRMFPELSELANIESRLVRNMSSDDMRFAHYNILARGVLEEVRKDVAGVIVTHGTDTLHYTAAALAFALEGLNVPVVLVGSQRSSDRGSSDASSNLLGAVRWITESKVPGVVVAMHEASSDGSIAIIDGLHARKQHSSRRDAFVSVNAPLLGRVSEDVEVLDTFRAAWLKEHAGKPQVLPFNEDLKVGWWKAHPQSFPEEFEVFASFDGLLLEGTGLGHVPITGIDEFTKEFHPKIREKIEALIKKIPVVMTTQTIFGRINMNVYSPGRKIMELGVLGQGMDMLPETAFVKLAWVLSTYPKEISSKYSENLRGEFSARSPLEDSHN